MTSRDALTPARYRPPGVRCTVMPRSGGEAEPALRVAGVDVTRFGEPIAPVQIQPAAMRAPKKHALVLVGRDLLNVAEVHVLVVATEVATPVIHVHEGSRWSNRSWLPSVAAGCQGAAMRACRTGTGRSSVVVAGPGSGWSEVPVCGGRPAALD